MEIRLARETDIDGMARMIGELFGLEPDFAAEPERQTRGLKALLASPSAAAFVAEDEGELLGMATIQLLVSTAEGGPSGLLEDLFVEPAARRAGLAGRLVAAAENWARGQGATRVQLLADRDNAPALAFYDAIGYAPTRMVARRRSLRASG